MGIEAGYEYYESEHNEFEKKSSYLIDCVREMLESDQPLVFGPRYICRTSSGQELMVDSYIVAMQGHQVTHIDDLLSGEIQLRLFIHDEEGNVLGFRKASAKKGGWHISFHGEVEVSSRGAGVATVLELAHMDLMQRISNRLGSSVRWRISDTNYTHYCHVKDAYRASRANRDEFVKKCVERQRWLALYGPFGKLGADEGSIEFDPESNSPREDYLLDIDTIHFEIESEPRMDGRLISRPAVNSIGMGSGNRASKERFLYDYKFRESAEKNNASAEIHGDEIYFEGFLSKLAKKIMRQLYLDPSKVVHGPEYSIETSKGQKLIARSLYLEKEGAISCEVFIQDLSGRTVGIRSINLEKEDENFNGYIGQGIMFTYPKGRGIGTALEAVTHDFVKRIATEKATPIKLVLNNINHMSDQAESLALATNIPLFIKRKREERRWDAIFGDGKKMGFKDGVKIIEEGDYDYFNIANTHSVKMLRTKNESASSLYFMCDWTMLDNERIRSISKLQKHEALYDLLDCLALN